MLKLIEEIIGHLGAAQVQRTESDDRIIAAHVDEAMRNALALLEMIRNVGEIH